MLCYPELQVRCYVTLSAGTCYVTLSCVYHVMLSRVAGNMLCYHELRVTCDVMLCYVMLCYVMEMSLIYQITNNGGLAGKGSSQTLKFCSVFAE